MVEKVLSNNNYVVRRINTNKTQTLHRIRLRQCDSDRPFGDFYQKENLLRDKNIALPLDVLYTRAWEADFELFIVNPIPYQDLNVIESRGVIENLTPANPGSQIIVDGQNLTIDPVIDYPNSRDVGHSTVTEQNSDLTSESHTEGNQVLPDPTGDTNTEYTNDTPSTSETNDLHNDHNTRGGNYNLRPDPNSNFSGIYRY